MAKRFIVSPSESGEEWTIEEEGMGGQVQTAMTREEAIRKGEEMARREMAMLEIQNEDGEVQDTRDFTEEGGRGM